MRPRSSILPKLAVLAVALVVSGAAFAEQSRFPAPEFRSGYKPPGFQLGGSQWAYWPYVDIAALAGSLGLASWLVYARRSRVGVLLLTIGSVAYFGFFRKGCVCPVGSIQNMSMAAGGAYIVPLTVAVIFILPLLFAIFYGRVFCSGVCPLGAIQDLFVWKPLQVPGWVESSLGLFAWIYLGLAVLVSAIGSDFLVCRYDPFVGLYRLSATSSMLLIGALLLVGGIFIGRIYCRFICPYGVLLKLFSIFSRRKVTITPDNCIDCRLCEKSCPFGAIRIPDKLSEKEKVAARRLFVGSVVAAPVFVIVLAIVGYFSGPTLARLDFNVRLADRILAEETGAVAGTTEESAGYRATAMPVSRLFDTARTVEDKYLLGGAVFGGYIGLVVGGKLISASIRKRREGYVADAGNCLACARCFAACPVPAPGAAPGSRLKVQPVTPGTSFHESPAAGPVSAGAASLGSGGVS